MLKRDKWLITIDLDGTLLTSPSGDLFNHVDKNEHSSFSYNKYNLKVINKLLKSGHKVAIVTGRPWNNTKKIYKSLGLKTMIANYNGAHIHYPDHKEFIDLTFSINLEILIKIINEPLVKNFNIGIAIETLEKNYILEGSNKEIMKYMNINQNHNSVKWNYGDKIKTNPQSALISIDYNKVDPYEILYILRRKYGNSMFFRLWDARKYGWLVLEINQKAANKGFALEYMAAYYNIPMTNTIAFGDGLNDREMLLKAAQGVAMKNAKGTVKTYADDITDYDNNDAGVGKYLEKFFKLR